VGVHFRPSGLTSGGDRMKFWHPLIFDPIDQLADAAQILEATGFEGAGIADHLAIPIGFESVHPSGENPFTPESPFPDTFTTIAALSMVTQRLRFMSYVYVVPLRDPFTVAKQVATTATLSKGRTILGVGAGWLNEEFSLVGQSFSNRGARLDEQLEIIQDLWEDGRAQYAGRHYTFAEAAMFPIPDVPIPIWVGGKSRIALRRAAGHDGWLGMNYPMEDIRRLLDLLWSYRSQQKAPKEDFEVFVIPNATPSLDLYRELEDLGVTATMGMAWVPDDQASASLEAKKAAAGRFSQQFIERLN
jgi:probable F420-dependent oxidoreductase